MGTQAKNLSKMSVWQSVILISLYSRAKQHRGHTYQPHPVTWPPVQREMMVCSYPQGSTCIATWRARYVLYRALVLDVACVHFVRITIGAMVSVFRYIGKYSPGAHLAPVVSLLPANRMQLVGKLRTWTLERDRKMFM